MIPIALPEKNIQLEFPEEISELTNDQFQFLCKCICQFISGELSFFDLKIHVLYKFLNIKRSTKKLSEEEYLNRNSNVLHLSDLVENFFNTTHAEGKERKQIKLDCTENKIPFLKVGFQKYIGPKDLFLNITFGEFIEAQTHFQNYIKTNSEEDLNLLAATLYRESKPKTRKNKIENYQGDKRIKFHVASVETRAKKFKKVPIHLKFGIFIYFASCLEFIATEVIEVSGNPINLSPLFQKSESNNESIGLVSVLFSLSESGVFGDKEKTEEELYWTILLKLYDNHLNIKNIERNAKTK
ncbi:hypothetical protein [Aureivirga marina]|uniref:hypothetical protein n=1 Tax=Aureivirga marina TaxID=1182451 RepID=UPI0018CBC2B8|nr:hypothetical protein [Aureivirga marina]